MPLDAKFNPLYKIILYISNIHCNTVPPFIPRFSPVVSSFEMFLIKFYNHFSPQCYMSCSSHPLELNTYITTVVPAGRLPTLITGPAVIIIGPPMRRLKFLPSLIQDSDWLMSRWWRRWWATSMHITWFHLPKKSINVNTNCLLVSGYHSLQKYLMLQSKQTKHREKINLPSVLWRWNVSSNICGN